MDKHIIFYHGTDARMVRMNKKERNNYFADCFLIIDKLWPFYKSLLKSEYIEKIVHGEKRLVERLKIDLLYQDLIEEQGELNYYDLREKILMLRDNKRGNGLYQYGSLYVATTEKRASSYARRAFAGGELGLITYRLIQGANIIHFEHFHKNPEIERAMVRVIKMATCSKKEPVIFKLEHLNIENLQWEDGRPIDYNDKLFSLIAENASASFRYNGDVDFDFNSAKFI